MCRPRLRGWVHAVATPLAVLGAWVLWRSAAPDGVRRASVLVFGVALVGLFATSALYHLPRWEAGARRILSRCDGAMIQLFIAATFTPIAVHALSGAWRTWSLATAWTVAAVGAMVAASPVRGPRWAVAAGYVAFGWLAVV
ncbi:MAG TPA: hemolysin III family protein, partial [Nitriliruptorales bacterium]|nr:hemolysin III family protein [Nitriliruptorales bacterium]